MSAHAEWKYYNQTDTDIYYIDYSRIKAEGKYKSMWYLDDFKSPRTDSSGKQYKSTITKRVFDCYGSRTQIVAIYAYFEQMGNGQLVVSETSQIKESTWEYPPPSSVMDGLINIACATNSNPKPPPSNTQDNKRQRCINLGLAPNSADFQQCMK